MIAHAPDFSLAEINACAVTREQILTVFAIGTQLPDSMRTVQTLHRVCTVTLQTLQALTPVRHCALFLRVLSLEIAFAEPTVRPYLQRDADGDLCAPPALIDLTCTEPLTDNGFDIPALVGKLFATAALDGVPS